MARRRRQLEYSAESAQKSAARPATADTAWHTWPTPIRDKNWTDRQGDRWRMRGGLLTAKQARRLLRRPDVAILHVYGLDSRQVTRTRTRRVDRPDRAVLRRRRAADDRLRHR
jgi:hypothetical protein